MSRARKRRPATSTALMVGSAGLLAAGTGIIAWPTAFLAMAAFAAWKVITFKKRRRARK